MQKKEWKTEEGQNTRGRLAFPGVRRDVRKEAASGKAGKPSGFRGMLRR